MSSDVSNVDQAVAAARKAEQAKDLTGALAAWENVRRASPDEPIGYSGTASILRQLNRVAEARGLLESAMVRFTTDERIAGEYAWLAHHCGDWLEADRRWSDYRQRFPQSESGFFGGAVALRLLRRFDEADALYEIALGRWPSRLNLLMDYAAVAQARGDFAEASRRWQAARVLHPEEPAIYLREAHELRALALHAKAETLIADLVRQVPNDAAALIEFAHIAQQRGDPTEALKRWDVVVSSFHGLVDGYVGAANALNELGRFADAQNVLGPAVRMFPESSNVAILNAWIAHYRSDYETALERWTEVRRRFPGDSNGYTGAVVSLQALVRMADADALIEEAVRLFPDDVHVAMSFARLPQQIQDWVEAERRWAAVHERFPNVVAVKTGYAICLQKAGKADEAEAILAAAVARHGNDIWVLRTYAEHATEQRDWPNAEGRWRRITERFESQIMGWVGLAEMLRAAGRLDDSDAVLAAALPQFAGRIDLERQRALNATLRRDWPLALRLWKELKAKYPQNGDVIVGIRQALWKARQDLGVAMAEGSDAPFEIPASLLSTDDGASGHAVDLGKFFLKFESIGDTCEFGIVQRRFGAEPISLLRWASISPAPLVTALDTKFAGVGEAEYTIVVVINGEYTTRDTRYHMFSHTFTPETAEPLETFTRQTLRRMQFLRRKLIDDLATGEKIFVYKSIHGLSDEEALAIYAAIRRYGGYNALLCMRLEDEGHPQGTLHTLEDGLFIGYIDRFSTVDINVDVWVDICKRTQEIWSGQLQERSQAA